MQRLLRPFFLLAMLAPIVSLWGQSERGTISGTITDTSGAVIQNAKITVTNTSTNTAVTIQTNDTGAFNVPNLVVGSYNVRVEMQGFKPALVSGITVNAASSIRTDVSLQVGSSTETVEVQAEAIALQTDNAKASTTITNKLVDELPLVVGGAMRSVFDLAQLTPEAKNFGDNNFIIGGGQAASYGTTLDGISANTTRALQMSWVAVNAPSLEAVTEFTVDSNGFKAEYGHAGGGAMTFASKSGTNQYHATAYEFLRNDAMDARRFFEARRGVYKQSDFGFSFGGPVNIPWLYKGKDKTFFFTAYEGFRNRVGASSSTATVPTDEMYQGDFSRWVRADGSVIPIYDPLSLTKDATGRDIRTPYANNRVPTSQFDQLAIKTIQAYESGGKLRPNNGATPGSLAYVTNNYFITSGTVLAPQNKFSIKGDHVFSEKNRLSGYVGINRTYENPGANGPNTLPGYYTSYNDTTRHSDVYRLSWDHNFSPTLLNHFYAGGNNWRENHDPPTATIRSGINWKDKVCLPNVPDCDQNILNLNWDGYTGWGGRANNGSENTVFGFNNDTTWIKGNHTVKFGAMHQRNHYNGFGRQCVAGCANFSFRGTNVPNDNNSLNGGNAFASFLLGWASNGSIDTIRFISQQWPHWAGYIQDDWRLSKKLTLSFGLRWETTLPPVEAQDRWSDFAPDRLNPRADNIRGALIYAGTGEGREGTRTLADTWFGGYGPRIGFAYQLNDKTVIRTNFARSFATITTVTGSTHQRGFTLTYSTGEPAGNLAPAYRLNAGLPPYQIPPFVNPSFANGDSMPWWQGQEATRAPENLAWNFSIQRQLSSNTIVDIAYNANAGTHLQANLLNYNQVPIAMLERYGQQLLSQRVDSAAAQAAGFRAPFSGFIGLWGGRGTVAQSLRPYPQYQTIDTAGGGGDHSGHSAYHAGVIKFEKRGGGGLTFQTSYVFSKIITDADSYWLNIAGAADHFNRRLEKSIGQFDVTHNFKLGMIYDLPWGKGRKWMQSGVASTLLGGWRLSSIHYYATGTPIALGWSSPTGTVFASRAVPQVSTYEGWRGNTGGQDFDPGAHSFFQTGNVRGGFFEQPAGLLIGNNTRFNPSARTLANLNENISLGKTFAVTERFRIDLRGEAFNLFNRAVFGTGSTNINDPNFGNVRAARDVRNEPRRMQVGLKLYF